MTSRPARLLAVTALVSGLIAPSVAGADTPVRTIPEHGQSPTTFELLERPTAPAGEPTDRPERTIPEHGQSPTTLELELLERPDAPDGSADGTQLTVLSPGQSRMAVGDVRMPELTNPGAEARNDFNTLSGALVSRFAQRDGVSVEQFVSANAVQGPTALPAGLDAKALDAQLAKAGLSFDGAKVGSLSQWAAQLSSKPSIDAAVTLKAAGWAAEVSKLAMPTLQAPGGHTAALGDEALMFGLFAKESITDLVANHPDVFDQISRTGIGTPAGQAAFRDSMLGAWGKLDEGLGSGLLDGCAAGFMAAMASGSAQVGANVGGSDCGGCAASGLGANHLMNQLFDFGTGANSTLFRPGDDTIAMQEWFSMQEWVADALVEGNPHLQELNVTEGRSGACRNGGAADTVGTVLPDIYSGLLD